MPENASNVGGQVQIADDVISVIAGTASLEIDGVSGMVGNFAGEIIEKIVKKNFSKGVDISVQEKDVTVKLNLVVRFGCKIQQVCAEVQKNVKNAIETMTGLSVVAVNINVAGIDIEEDKPVNNSDSE